LPPRWRRAEVLTERVSGRRGGARAAAGAEPGPRRAREWTGGVCLHAGELAVRDARHGGPPGPPACRASPRGASTGASAGAAQSARSPSWLCSTRSRSPHSASLAQTAAHHGSRAQVQVTTGHLLTKWTGGLPDSRVHAEQQATRTDPYRSHPPSSPTLSKRVLFWRGSRYGMVHHAFGSLAAVVFRHRTQ
jgi:hypothetical protein